LKVNLSGFINLTGLRKVMRFIIHELPYERPLLAGQLRYERDGEPTGAVESWRLTCAVDGYRFLRVDLDARQALSGRSMLFHATLNPAGGLEQLKYRFWGDSLVVSGTLVSETGIWLAGRTVNGTGYQDEATGEGFWFPAAMGLSLLIRMRGGLRAVTLETEPADPGGMMGLREFDINIQSGDTERMPAGGEIVEATSLTIDWPANRRTVWMDVDNRVLRLMRYDGLSATAARLVRYG
jgi:hypothetical protein